MKAVFFSVLLVCSCAKKKKKIIPAKWFGLLSEYLYMNDKEMRKLFPVFYNVLI